jgi:hypothetical protein
MPNAIEPKSPPKVNISARVSPRALDLLKKASVDTGKTQSAIVDECVLLTLGDKKGKSK